MQEVKIKDKKIKILKSIAREFEYFLSFLDLKEKVYAYFFDSEYYIEIRERSIIINHEFFNIPKEDKILFLITRFFEDYKFIQFIYLKLYLRRQDKYILNKINVTEKELQKMKVKFLRKNYNIKLY